MKMKFFILAFLVMMSSAAVAQETVVPDATAAVTAAPLDPAAVAAAEAATAAAVAQRQAILNQPFRQSLLFTPLEIATIERANAGKPASSAILDAGKPQAIPPRRVITLSGVLVRKPGDWIVWLNGHKIIPKQLLPEIVDIQVTHDTVHLKWFDIGMNKIISISLRPHQTYDIVTGLLLPG